MPKNWIIAAFEPVSLFSLRSTYATSKGGKTLLVPTPYAVKMALLDASFRASGPSADGEAAARSVFDLIKRSPVRVRPPLECIVHHTFVRSLQPARTESQEPAEQGPFTRTIIYREFVAYTGEMLLALGLDTSSHAEVVARLFAHVDHFGKRGSFFQFSGMQAVEGELPPGFSLTEPEIAKHPLDQVAEYRTMQYLDEFGQKLHAAKDGFERISTYHDGTIQLNQHRVLERTLLPYRIEGAGKHFTHDHRTIG